MIKKNEEGRWTIKTTHAIELLLIIVGIGIRVFMLVYYYIVHTLNPAMSWGDVEYNYGDIRSIFTGEWDWETLAYPPLTNFFLVFLRLSAFGIFEIYVFYAFSLEFITAMLFYLVLKRFDIPKRNIVFGLFLVNPFVFLNYVFSPNNCGYSITDTFFSLLLVIALLYYPRENKAVFYVFLGLSVCAKWYTIPAVAYFFIKFVFEKNWVELKKVIIFIGAPIVIFLIMPLLYLPNYLDLYLAWTSPESRHVGTDIPLVIKLIPISILFITFVLFRLKKADTLEIVFFSIITMVSFMFFAKLYMRYLTPLVYYGHLKTKENIMTIDIDVKFMRMYFRVGNHLLTFILSVIGCIAAIGIILFVF